MRDIGFVLHNFKDRARRNWCLPDELFPWRLDRRRAARRTWGLARCGFGFELEARRRVIHRPRLVMRCRVDAPARENLRLGMDSPARFDERCWCEATIFAAGDVRGANRVADEAHDRQVGRGNNQAGYGFETHAMPKAKPAGNLAWKFSDVQIVSVNAGESNLRRFSRTRDELFRL